jgi:hypothetical protein
MFLKARRIAGATTQIRTARKDAVPDDQNRNNENQKRLPGLGALFADASEPCPVRALRGPFN